MDDDFAPPTTPRFWISLTIFCIAFALWVVVAATKAAYAQDKPLCAPLSQIIPAWRERFQEHVIWEGVVPAEQGAVEFVLTQSDKQTWSLFVVQNGIACLRAAGQDGTDVGRGV